LKFKVRSIRERLKTEEVYALKVDLMLTSNEGAGAAHFEQRLMSGSGLCLFLRCPAAAADDFWPNSYRNEERSLVRRPALRGYVVTGRLFILCLRILLQRGFWIDGVRRPDVRKVFTLDEAARSGKTFS
jgi:hypothetical protein